MPKDYTAARAWFEKAAAAGFAASMTQVGSICTNAPGIAADPVQARHWYEKASSAGDLFGMQYTAMHMDKGQGGPADPVQAAHLMLRSAKLGHAWSLTVLTGPLTFVTPATRTELKREVARLGYYTGTIDDTWDPATQAAVKAYLKAAV